VCGTGVGELFLQSGNAGGQCAKNKLYFKLSRCATQPQDLLVCDAQCPAIKCSVCQLQIARRWSCAPALPHRVILVKLDHDSPLAREWCEVLDCRERMLTCCLCVHRVARSIGGCIQPAPTCPLALSGRRKQEVSHKTAFLPALHFSRP
jgi:hypothetical protein